MLRLLLLSVLLVLLAACESTPTSSSQLSKTSTSNTGRGTGSILDLIAAAELAGPDRANGLRLQAAELALANGDTEQTTNILAALQLPTSTAIEREYALLQARLAIALEDGPSALSWLRKPAITSRPLDQSEQITLGRLRAEAYRVGRSYLASARERIFFDPLLSPEEQALNHEAIFATLLALPQKSLNLQAQKAITSELRGWLSLAAMTKQYQSNPVRQLEALGQWRQVWSSHPAATRLPERLSTLSAVVENQPKSLALFLPLHGDLAPFGRAIRDAIIASRYQLERDIDIRIYDTSRGPIESLLDQAVSEGAELGIGPLDREKVTRLAKNPALPMPILALNRTIDGSNNPNLYQFALAPEDEMVQVADQVFREGKRNALIVFPDSEWGERNVTAFKNRWLSLGGNITASSAYTTQKDYSTMIKSLLDVDSSEDRANNLRRIIGQSLEFTPRRRQDIDFVFLLGNQTQARGINPTLAFYYAEDIPVYSTSHVYEFGDSRIESIDLNGIRFCDIPFKLNSADPSQQQLQTLWPASRTALAPFYALGIDAFHLYPRLEQMKQLGDEKIYGSTGILSLNPQNILIRQLLWAQFADGAVITSPQVVAVRDER
ncbi:MAG: outer membrane PBP1 activator LpoA protein [Litorivivens sp.]|jgi:outer membrane PBP1 activator LpoA protein